MAGVELLVNAQKPAAINNMAATAPMLRRAHKGKRRMRWCLLMIDCRDDFVDSLLTRGVRVLLVHVHEQGMHQSVIGLPLGRGIGK